MSYSDIKPEYYRMFQPDSPWHAGSEGWASAPWPGWGRNPNLVGQPRVGLRVVRVDGLPVAYLAQERAQFGGATKLVGVSVGVLEVCGLAQFSNRPRFVLRPGKCHETSRHERRRPDTGAIRYGLAGLRGTCRQGTLCGRSSAQDMGMLEPSTSTGADTSCPPVLGACSLEG